MINDNLKQSLKGWLVVFIGAVFYMYQFMVRVSPNVMNDELIQVLSIDAGTLGSLIGVYYWAYSLMQLPLGITMDRIGPRYFLCAASFLLAASCFIFGNTTDIYVAGAARFMMGLGSACGLVGTIKLGTLWVRPKHIAKVTSLAILMGTIGAGLGGMPLKYVLMSCGFELTMEILALIGVGVGIIVFISLKVHPPSDNPSARPDIYKNDNPIKNLSHIICSKQAWIAAIYGMLMYAPITIIGIAWGVPFIQKSYNISEMLAASVVSTMFLGAAVGSPLAAFISDIVMKNRRVPMFLGSLVAALVWTSVLFVPNIPLTAMYALFFCGGVAYTFKTLTFACICEIMPRSFSGTSIAFVNMIVMSTGIIFHPAVGNLIDYSWNGTMMGGYPLYSIEDYRFALLIIPCCVMLSGVLLLFMRESHPEASIVKEFGSIPDTELL